MSEQEFTKRHEAVIRGLCFGVGVILTIIIMRQCNGSTTHTKTIYGTLHDTVKVEYTRIVPKEKIVVKNVPYEKIITDTLHINGETIYIEPIDTLKTQAFSKTMEDEHLKLTMSGIVTGRINDIKADYEIKPMEIKKPSRWSLGFGVGVDVHGKPNLTAGITYQAIRF